MVVYSPIDAKFIYTFRGVITNHSSTRLTTMGCERRNYNSNTKLKEGLYAPFIPEMRFKNRTGVKYGEIKGMVAYEVTDINKETFHHPLIPYILSLGFEGDVERLISVYNKSYQTDELMSLCYMNRNGCCTDDYIIINSSEEDDNEWTIVPYYKKIIKKLVHNFTCGDFSPICGRDAIIPVPQFIDFANETVWDKYRQFLKDGLDNVEINELRTLFGFDSNDIERDHASVNIKPSASINPENVLPKPISVPMIKNIDETKVNPVVIKETYSIEYFNNLKNYSEEE